MGIRFLVESDKSNGSVTVFECAVPANARMPAPHSHDAFEETIYGLEGVSTWTVDGVLEIGGGDSVCIPRGTVHAFTNRGSVDTRFLAIATPGVFGSAYFREVADVLFRRRAARSRRHRRGDAAPRPDAGRALRGLRAINPHAGAPPDRRRELVHRVGHRTAKCLGFARAYRTQQIVGGPAGSRLERALVRRG